MLAACGSQTGASRAVFQYCEIARWRLLTGKYGLSEVARNLPKLPTSAVQEWRLIRNKLTIVRDVVTYRHPLSPLKSKDIPVIATALAWADVLLTLDDQDFGRWIGQSFNGLSILKPADFLTNERRKGLI